MRRLAQVVAGCLSSLLLVALAVPARADDDEALVASKYLNRLFIVTCAYSHTSADDPIGKPGQPGASHSHDFFGNTTTDAYSTLATLQHGGTTCNRPQDTAGYWMPTVSEDGAAIRPGVATFYYRAPGTDAGAVTAFPPGFRMIAGDMEAMSPQSLNVVEWACREEGAKKPWRADIPQCPSGSTLAFRANFPDCWNGVDLDSPDHRSHVAYSDKSGRCPAGFPVRVPEIAMTATYPGVHGGTLMLSTHSPYGGHADFFNAWQPGALENLVDGCLHDERNCGDFAGPGGAGPLGPQTPQGPAAPAAAARIDRLTPAATDATTFAQHAVLSAQGGTVAYEQHAQGSSQIAVRPAGGGPAEAMSVTASGRPANGNSYWPTVSADGRFVAFVSDATDLVAGDTNGIRDAFVRDRVAGTTTRISGPSGQPDGAAAEPSISADGRYLAFTSFADNLVAGDVNRHPDVFRATLGAHTVELVSAAPGGAPGDQSSSQPDISADGRYVAFASWSHDLTADDTNRWSDVFVRDLTTGHTTLVSRTDAGRSADNSSYFPSVSDDGTLVSFESAATNLVPGDKGLRDVFVRALPASRTYRISARPYQRVEGVSANAQLSGDGRTVIFQSANWRLAGNVRAAADVFTTRPDGSNLRLVSTGGDQPSTYPSISTDGRQAAFESAASTLAPGSVAGDLEVYSASLSPTG